MSDKRRCCAEREDVDNSRRSFLRGGTLSAMGLLALSTRQLAAKEETRTYRMEQIRSGVGFFYERGGTVGWLMTGDAVVVVDTDFPEGAVHLLAEIERRTSKPIEFVINTHHHGSHTSGNSVFQGKARALVAHENSKKNQLAEHERKGIWNRLTKTPDQYFPDVTFVKTWSRKIGGETVVATYLGPGHTDGDVLVHFQNANVVHAGDMLYHKTPPFFDQDAGASFLGAMDVVEKMIALFDEDTKFIAGHSGVAERVVGLREVKGYHEFLVRVRETVKVGIKAGRTKDQVSAIAVVPGAEEWRGDLLKSTLAAAYHELSKEPA